MAVARARLATQVHIIEGTCDIAIEGHGGAAGIGAASHEHLLHEPCRAVGHRLPLMFGGAVYLLTVTIDDAGDDDRIMHHAVVDYCAVGIDQLHQVHVAGT